MNVERGIPALLRGFLKHEQPVPYDSIGSIDSRMWDPEWKKKYGRSYYSLWRILTWGLKDPQKAQTMASGDSFYWGRRGGAPMLKLPELGNYSLRQLGARLQRWLNQVRGGQSITEVLQAALTPIVEVLTEVESDSD